jgi:hypothetical protein
VDVDSLVVDKEGEGTVFEDSGSESATVTTLMPPINSTPELKFVTMSAGFAATFQTWQDLCYSARNGEGVGKVAARRIEVVQINLGKNI